MPTAKDLFDTTVPQALSKYPDKAREIAAVYCFKITGPNGGTWTVDLVSNPPTCKPGEGATPQCTIDVADTDFEQMLGNPQLGMQLYFQGKLRVTGDPMLATRLQKLFTIGQ
ncbi:MAG TPA: SCP2 sterol-binding domain-containing protein [Polyangia bacterium]|nr:SCP2 sterol-binding domain-containing protein [Polyangia bacterium]